MRVNIVNRARNPQTCGRCGSDIPKGSPYRWAKSRYGPKMIRCMEYACRFRPTDLSGAKTARIDEAIEDAVQSLSDAVSYDDIKSVLESVAEVVREVSEEYREANDAWAGGQGRDDWQELQDACESFADELESWEFSEETDEEEIRQSVRDEEDEPEQGETEDEYEERLKDLEDAAWNEQLDRMREEAEDVLSSFSV